MLLIFPCKSVERFVKVLSYVMPDSWFPLGKQGGFGFKNDKYQLVIAPAEEEKKRRDNNPGREEEMAARISRARAFALGE